jgi:hypothetical protein
MMSSCINTASHVRSARQTSGRVGRRRKKTRTHKPSRSTAPALARIYLSRPASWTVKAARAGSVPENQNPSSALVAGIVVHADERGNWIYNGSVVQHQAAGMSQPTPLNLNAESFADLPADAHALILRLLSILAAEGAELPEEMLGEIERISIAGADPQWQMDEMEKILSRWMPRH